MGEIERKWFGDKSKHCSESDKLATPKNLGLASFWVLFVSVAVVAGLVVVFYVVRLWLRRGRKNYDSLPWSLKELYLKGESVLKNEYEIFISLDDNVFGHGFEFSIRLEDIIQFCELEPISWNCMVVYIWHLYEIMKAKSMVGEFQFVNPFGESHVSTTTRDEQVHALLKGLEGVSPNQLAIVPCNVEEHWILTVIDPHKGIVYSFDPLRHQIPGDNWKQIVNEAITRFNENLGRQDNQPRWNIIKGPIQPDPKQCGFFVMRYMNEIIHKLATSRSICLNSHFYNRRYSQEEIDEIRIEWATCMLGYIKYC